MPRIVKNLFMYVTVLFLDLLDILLCMLQYLLEFLEYMNIAHRKLLDRKHRFYILFGTNRKM